MASSPPARAHILLACAPLQGHVNPLLVLGRRLASRGLLVTFSTIPHAGLKFTHADGETTTDIAGRGMLHFEHLQGGGLWPPHDPRYVASGGDTLLRHLEDAAPAALAGLIRRQSDAGRPVAVVVASAFVPWARRVAAGEGVRHALLWTESCSVLSLFYHFFHSLARTFPSDTAAPVVGVPGMPAMAAGDLPVLIHAPEQFIWRQVLVAELNSLRDDATASSWLLWLDVRPPRSVVFVAFGSLVKLEPDEVTELVAGLAATGRPFLLVVRDDDDNRAAIAGDSGSKGKVVAWCSQGRALASGVPVVTFPAWADQPTNAKFLESVYGVGVRLPRPMARGAVSRCVEEVMSGPEAAVEGGG
nr:unnamed protein product [Digitaria exilis]